MSFLRSAADLSPTSLGSEGARFEAGTLVRARPYREGMVPDDRSRTGPLPAMRLRI